MIELTEAEQDTKYAQLAASAIWQGPNVPACVLISAYVEDYGTLTNELYHEILKDDLRNWGWSFKEVTGSWKGEQEQSFLVILSSDIHEQTLQIERLLQLAHVFDQDAILVLDRYRNATLAFPTGEADQLIGKFRPVPEAYAKAQEGWTYDPQFEQYYAIL